VSGFAIDTFRAHRRIIALVLATLPYRLATITTLPSPDSPWTSITVTGASLREPTPFLQFMWRTDIQGTNP
jgi:hypothetical protein